jgi:hypothetical protein
VPIFRDFCTTRSNGETSYKHCFFASGQPKDDFAAIPSAMGAKYQPIFQSRLLALNAGYTTNALGQTANAFTGLLATDVLNVKHLENNFSMELMF